MQMDFMKSDISESKLSVGFGSGSDFVWRVRYVPNFAFSIRQDPHLVFMRPDPDLTDPDPVKKPDPSKH